MALADILESVGSGIDPSYGTNPHIPGIAAFGASALSSFSAGRAARRKLAASQHRSDFEGRLGMPLDAFEKMSPEIKMEILKNRMPELMGPGEGGKPLESLGGLTMDQIMNQGSPAVTSPQPAAGPLALGQQRPQIPVQTREAIPPLSAVPAGDRPFFMSKLGTGISMPESPGDAALREGRQLGNKKAEAELPFAGQMAEADLENKQASTEHLRSLTEGERQARRLSAASSKLLPAPSDLVGVLRRNGVQIPEGSTPSYQDLDYYMKGSFAWGELQALINEHVQGFQDQIDQGRPITKKDILEFAKTRIKGQLDQINGRMARDEKDLAQKLFVQQLLDQLTAYEQSRRNHPAPSDVPEGQTPYGVPGQ